MRPTLTQAMLGVAQVLSWRGTCPRRQVGCVLTDNLGRILATGYNGVPRGQPHCLDNPCPGAGALPGESLDLCEASHAEANAVAFCSDITRVAQVYCTASPCLACVKLLLQTGATELYFLEEYPHELARDRWTRDGRLWIKHIGGVTL